MLSPPKSLDEMVALLSLTSWCLVIVVWFFLAVPWVCRQFAIVVYSDHTHYFLCVSYLHKWGLQQQKKKAPRPGALGRCQKLNYH